MIGMSLFLGSLFTPLINVPPFMPILWCFDYYSSDPLKTTQGITKELNVDLFFFSSPYFITNRMCFKQHSMADSCQCMTKTTTIVLTILWLLDTWSKLERWESSINRCLMRWPKIKKIILLKCRLLLLYATTSHLSIRLWCAIKSGF